MEGGGWRAEGGRWREEGGGGGGEGEGRTGHRGWRPDFPMALRDNVAIPTHDCTTNLRRRQLTLDVPLTFRRFADDCPMTPF